MESVPCAELYTACASGLFILHLSKTATEVVTGVADNSKSLLAEAGFEEVEIWEFISVEFTCWALNCNLYDFLCISK